MILRDLPDRFKRIILLLILLVLLPFAVVALVIPFAILLSSYALEVVHFLGKKLKVKPLTKPLYRVSFYLSSISDCWAATVVDILGKSTRFFYEALLKP